jgi:hypothetical protein
VRVQAAAEAGRRSSGAGEGGQARGSRAASTISTRASPRSRSASPSHRRGLAAIPAQFVLRISRCHLTAASPTFWVVSLALGPRQVVSSFH